MDHFIEHYFYKGRILLFIPLLYLFSEWILSVPTREIVYSSLFVYTVLFLAFYTTLFIYMYTRSYKALLFMIVPTPIILLSRERYSEGLDHSYEILYYIFFSLIVIQLILWFISLFFKIRSLDDTLEAKDITLTHNPELQKSITKKKKKDIYALNISVSIRNSRYKVANLTIEKIYDCIYTAELIGCEGSIDFTAQYLEFVETGKSKTVSYPITCSYFKFGDYHQVKDVYTVTLY